MRRADLFRPKDLNDVQTLAVRSCLQHLTDRPDVGMPADLETRTPSRPFADFSRDGQSDVNPQYSCGDSSFQVRSSRVNRRQKYLG
jgi:hypothetical protein